MLKTSLIFNVLQSFVLLPLTYCVLNVTQPLSVCVAVLQAVWCTPTSRSQRSRQANQVKATSWTSKARWLYDRDTGFNYFYADEQKTLFLVRLLFMDYFRDKVDGNGVLVKSFTTTPPAVAMLRKPSSGIVGWFLFFDVVFFLNICILILCLWVLRRRETGKQCYLC